MRNCISHVRILPNGTKEIQTNEEHSKNVALLAERFASKFGLGSWGKIAGLFHDLGKESKEFQEYIKYHTGLSSSKPTNPHPKHSIYGAKALSEHYGSALIPIIGNVITGHHSGIKNSDEIINEISKLENVSFAPYDKPGVEKPVRFNNLSDISLIAPMILSCLVDADRLDTEHFMDENKSTLREMKQKPLELLKILDAYIDQLQKKSQKTKVNEIRSYVLERCKKAACDEQGIYSLTVPTGGGKTLSSLRWALGHAVSHNLDRVIIAIPYTSIIEQTASILKSIFGEENVLEHHSQINEDDETQMKLQLAVENWDVPIIVTTNVQLFESLFSSKASKCRKLHNICKAVIILDEVQTLPIQCYSPIIERLKSLKRKFGVSILLTTASQPILTGKWGKRGREFSGFEKVKEIIETKKECTKN